MLRGTFISIEGNIGAGKSTLAKGLASHFNLKLFEEPVDANPYLEKFYAEPKKYALDMQLWLLASRFRDHVQGTELAWKGMGNDTGTNGVLFDRSLYGDSVFERVNYDLGNIDDVGHEHYHMHRDTMMRYVMAPHKVLYLKVAPEVCMERIAKRGRVFEKGITEEYLKHLEQYHVFMLNEMRIAGSDVHTLDWSVYQSVGDLIGEIEWLL